MKLKRFDELVIKEALGDATPEEISELDELSKLRRIPLTTEELRTKRLAYQRLYRILTKLDELKKVEAA